MGQYHFSQSCLSQVDRYDQPPVIGLADWVSAG